MTREAIEKEVDKDFCAAFPNEDCDFIEQARWYRGRYIGARFALEKAKAAHQETKKQLAMVKRFRLEDAAYYNTDEFYNMKALSTAKRKGAERNR